MPKRKRDYIPFPERLAAALSRLLPPEQEHELRTAKTSAKTIIALFHNDHIVLHALNGSDKWWNLDPKLKEPHKKKSAVDTSIVAKVRRIEKEPEKWLNLIDPKTKRECRLTQDGKKSGTLVRRRVKLRSANRWPPRGSRKISPYRRS